MKHQKLLRSTTQVLCSTLVIVIILSLTRPISAANGINKVINFQGKVVDSSGIDVPDGTYSFVFKMYDGPGSSASNSYTEDWTKSGLFSSTISSLTVTTSADGNIVYPAAASNQSTLAAGQILTNVTKGESTYIKSVNTGTQTITVAQTPSTWSTGDTITNQIYVKNGIFRATIGSLTAITGVDFNTSNVYLGVNFNSDGEMKPRIQYTATPYAMNAERVNGLYVTNTSGNSFTSTTTLKIGDGKTVQIDNGLRFTGTDGTQFTFPGSSGNVVTDTSTSTLTNKAIGSGGLTFSGATTDITTGTNEDLVIMPNGTGNVGIGTTSPKALLQLMSTSATIPAASISALTNMVGLIVDNTIGDLFTASSSGLSRFTITNSGGIMLGNSLGTSSQCLTGGTTASWGSCGSGGYIPWIQNNILGLLYPVNSTLDFLFGGQSSASAKLKLSADNFSPVASISGTTSKAALIVDNTTGDLFTASSSGLPRFTIQQNGNVAVGNLGNLLASAKVDIKDTNSLAVVGSTNKITAPADQDFSSNTGDWTTSGSPAWSINVNSSGKAVKDTPGIGAITLNNTALDSAPVSGNMYQVVFTAITTATSSGSLTPSFGSASGVAMAQGANGSYVGETQVIKATGIGALTFTPTSGWYGTIDNISVVPITANSLALRLESSNGAATPIEFRTGGSSNSNIFIGSNTGQALSSGTQNVALGANALSSVTTVSGLTAVGYNALANNTTGAQNSAFGASALSSNTTGNYNNASGFFSLNANTTGSANSAFGSNALAANTTGNSSNAFGRNALQNNSTGSTNNAFGVSAMFSNTTGSGNNAFGFLSLGLLNPSGSITAFASNGGGGTTVTSSAHGLSNGMSVTISGTTSYNGTFTISNVTTNTFDISTAFVANEAQGTWDTSAAQGNNNTAFGFEAGFSNKVGTGNVLLGYKAGYNELGSNKLYIANSNTSNPLIYGDFAASTLGINTSAGGNAALTVNQPNGAGDIFSASQSGTTKFVINNNGNVGIGTTSPNANLQLLGSFGTGATASISARSSFAGLLVDNTVGDLFTASSSGLSRFVITQNGSIGIGTTRPSAKLMIGDFQGSDTSNILLFGKTATSPDALLPRIHQSSVFGQDDLSIGAGGSGGIAFYTGNVTNNASVLGTNTSTVKMSIVNNGNVGIGTTAPKAGLQVFSTSGTGATASVSAMSSFAGLSVDNTVGDLFTASASGLDRFSITNAGGLRVNGSTGSSNQCLTGGTTAGWSSCGGSSLFTADGGGVFTYLTNTSQNLLLGGSTVSTGAFYLSITDGASPANTTLFLGTDGSKNGILKLYSSTTGKTATITNDSSGNLTLAAATGSSVIVGSGTGNITMSLANAADLFAADKTLTLSAGYTSNDFTFKRNFTGGTNTMGGAVVYITDVSGGSGTISNDLLLVNRAMTSGNPAGSLMRLQLAGQDQFTVFGYGTAPVASISANTSFAGLVVDNKGNGDLFTASSSGLNRFVIQQNGNVGIGTTTPTGKLAVSGNLVVSGGSPSTPGYSFIGDTSTGLFQQFAGNIGIATGGTERMHIWNNGNVSIASSNISGSLGVGTVLGTLPVASLSGTTSFAGLVVDNTIGDLFTASSSGLNRFAITNGGGIKLGGSIGTSSQCLLGGATASWGTCGTGASQWTTTGNDIYYTTGNIGIGTTSPNAVLQVVGNGTIPTASVSANTSFAGLAVDNRGLGDLFTASSSGLNRFLIKSNGNVGIGSGQLNPQALLHLYDSSGTTVKRMFQISFSNNVGAGAQMSFFSGDSLAGGSGFERARIEVVNTSGGESLRIYSGVGTTLTEYMRFEAGNVGIGTTAPTAKFNVAGNGTIPTASVSANTSSAGLIVDNSGLGDLFTASSSGLARFVITQNGSVGIGTTTPTGQLQIAATAVPSVDILTVGNASGQEATGNGINALQTTWFAKPSTGNANSAQRIDLTNNNTAAGGQTQGLRIVATGAGTTVASDTVGLLIDGLTRASVGSSQQNALEIGANWDSSIYGDGDLRINAVGNIIMATSSATTKVGIGTATPLLGVHISNANSASAAAMIQNTDATNTTSANQDGLAIKLGFTTAVGSGCTTNGNCNEYLTFLNGLGQKVGKLYASSATVTTLKSNGSDYAETFSTNDGVDTMPEGTLVCLTGDQKVSKCPAGNSQIIGIVSARATVVGGADGADKVIVGLLGQLPLYVTTTNGDIKRGDPLTSSSIPGVAMKATSPGQIVGHALEDYNGQDNGRVMTLVSPSFFDPSVFLMGDGNLTIAKDDQQRYQLTTASGQIFKNKGAFAEAAIANLSAGKIQTKELDVTDGLTVNGKDFSTYLQSLNSSSNSGVSLPDLTHSTAFTALSSEVDDLVKRVSFLEQQASSAATLSASTSGLSVMTTTNTASGLIDLTSGSTDTSILSELVAVMPVKPASQLTTDRLIAGLDVIAPKVVTHEAALATVSIASGSALTVQLGSDGKMSLLNEQNEGVILFDASGNAEFKGSVHAKTISADQIEGLNDIVMDLIKRNATASGELSDSSAASASAMMAQVLGIATSISTQPAPSFDSSSATVSGDLRVKGRTLLEGVVTALSDFTANNVIVSGMSNFMDSVFFHGAVQFMGHVTFNEDTAGYVIIPQGKREVTVTFTQEYDSVPVITSGLVTDETDQDKTATESAAPYFLADYHSIVTKRSTKGFTIVLNKPAAQPLTFSWSALSVKKNNISPIDSLLNRTGRIPPGGEN